MATATPHAGIPLLPAPLRGGRYTLGTRIVLSFGALFVLMLVMAAVSYTRLTAIDDEANSLQRDSVPGQFLSMSLRANTNESYSIVERALFVDNDADTMKRSLARLPDALRRLD
ncbi:methyl-accepting chemotaxis protein, partial [Paraburkholderia sp. Se-20369]|nr:methyl-accepting chemotaxis protein [Paraburkholderia sp. Se-20369]